MQFFDNWRPQQCGVRVRGCASGLERPAIHATMCTHAHIVTAPPERTKERQPA